MPVTPARVFLDASVLFAGAHSPKGPSGLVMEACTAGALDGVVSELVILEARRALASKSTSRGQTRLAQFLASRRVETVGFPSSKAMEQYLGLIHTKDVHVLTAAIGARCQTLLTLDKKHFFTPALQRTALHLTVATPMQFLSDRLASGE